MMICRFFSISPILLALIAFQFTGCSSNKAEEDEAVKAAHEKEEAEAKAEKEKEAEEAKAEKEKQDAEALAKTSIPKGAISQIVPTPDRVVRYILEDKTPVYDQADTKSPQTATFNRGDLVVVSINGEWAQIADNHFVEARLLSETGVGHVRNRDVWQGGTPVTAPGPLPEFVPQAPKIPPVHPEKNISKNDEMPLNDPISMFNTPQT